MTINLQKGQKIDISLIKDCDQGHNREMHREQTN